VARVPLLVLLQSAVRLVRPLPNVRQRRNPRPLFPALVPSRWITISQKSLPRTFINSDYRAQSLIQGSRGKVTFAITSSNVPPQKGVSTRDLLALRGRGRAGELHRRKIGQLEGELKIVFLDELNHILTSSIYREKPG